MGEFELAKELRRMYDAAPQGEQATAIHLFGIRFHRELSDKKVSKRSILKAAGIKESYVTEIAKGVRLGRYVVLRDDIAWCNGNKLEILEDAR